MKKTLLNIRYKSFLNLLLIFILPYVAVSQNNLKVESSATSVSYDENFALNVLLDNSEDVSALQLDIVYDSSSLKYQESYTASNIDGFNIGVNIVQPGLLRIIVYSTDNSVLSAELRNFLSLDFKSRFEPGDFDFTITDPVLSDASSNQLAVTTENGNTKVLGPKFVLTDSSLAFGDIPMLSDQQGSIRISNQGNAELIINQVSINSPFSVLDQIPISIAPRSFHNIQIDVDTSAKQQIIETCSFITNDTSSLRALQKTEVSTNIYAVNEIYIGTGSGPISTPITIPVTIENMEAFNGFQFDVALPNGFTYVEGSLSLSGREVDHSVSANMVDQSTLRLLSYSQSNSNFTGTNGEVLSFQVIADVNSGTFPLQIASSIISNSVLGNIESDSYVGSVEIDSPYLTLSKSTYNLGRVPINEIREMNLKITNTGQANLMIDEIIYTADELSSDIPIPLELKPSESSDRIISFSPDALGDFQKSLSIRNNSSDGQSIVSITADVFSPNYLKLNDTYTSPNTTFSVPVELSNLEDIRGIQFDIEIPGGFTFSSGDIALDNSLSNFNISSSSLGNDVYRVIIYTTGDAVIPAGTTTLLSMTLGTEEQTALGQYEFPISNVVLSNLSNQNVASEALGQGYVLVVESTAPVASDQNATADEDTALYITLSADDIDNDALTFYIDQQPVNGSLILTDNVVTYTPDENFNGSDSFTFYANDGKEDSNIATVSLTVNPVNDAPVASDQNVTTEEDTALDIILSANDIDNDPLTFVIDQQPTNGTVALTDNVVTYTPDENFNGSDSFTFYANDGKEDSNIATVSLTVNLVNDAPVATDQNATTDEETALDITLSADDIDNDPLTFVIDQQPTNGTVALTDNVVTYTPDENSNGSDSFTFYASDGVENSNIATVSLTVNPVNDAPVASDQNATTEEDTALDITLSATDIDNDPLTFVIDQQPTNGTVALTDNVVTYTPNENFNGSDSFTFYASDGVENSNIATVSLTVNPVNDAPVASDQNVTTEEDTALDITLSADDIDNDPLTFVIDQQPTNGTVALTDNVVTYTPDENFNGSDSFTFYANDGKEDSNIATVSITVNSVNDAPVATDQNATTDEDTALDITLSATDIDNDPLTFIINQQPANGTVSLTGNVVTYTPNENFNGSDSFTFHANDGVENSNIATVSLTVNPVNDAPVAADQNATTDEDTALDITLSATDIDNDPLTFYIDQQPAHGNVVLTDDVVTYTPNENFNGSDSFTFYASDGVENSNIATVSLTVNPVNDAPVATDQNATTDEETALDITLSADDIDNDPLTFVIDQQPTNGTVALTDNVVTYTPDENFNGSDSFTFYANDGKEDSNIATVSITVNSVNDAPVATDQNATTDEDTALDITLSADDIDKDALTFYIDQQPTSGTVSLTENVVTYTPDENFNGSDSFTFYANDGKEDSNIATVSLTVNPVNDAPVATDQNATTNEDTALDITLSANDIDNDPLTFYIDQQPTSGIVALTDNVVTYTPDENFNGSDSFTFYANDGKEDSNIATVSLTVNPVNDTPVASDQNVTTEEDTALDITLSANDIDNDPLTFYIDQQPVNGSLILTDNVVTYTPDENFNGSDSFIFYVSDGVENSNIATVSLTVNPVNDAPVATDQNATTNEDTALDITLSADDIDNDPLTFVIDQQPTNGTVALTDNVVTYTPNENFNGSDSFTFYVSDGVENSNIATVSLTVNPVNDAPVATDQNATTNEDTALDITLSADDIDNDPLTFVIDQQPTNGTVALTDNVVTYTPDENFNGSDSFTFYANDGKEDSNIATVSLTVNPVNDAPVASDQNVTTEEDTALDITLSANDIDNDALTFYIDQQPAHGTATLVDNIVTYTPNENFNGSDSFTFYVSDGVENSNIATVSLTVNPVNDAPVASDQNATTNEDTALDITLSANDIDKDALTFYIDQQPTSGTVSLTENVVTYTPDENFNGSDSFTFYANDGKEDSNIATVYIEVEATLGIEDFKNDDVKIYPNPFSGSLTVELHEAEEISVFDLKGRLLKTYITVNTVNHLQLDVLPDGVYILSIKRNNQFINKKIIKQNR